MPFSPASVLAKIIESREQDIRLKNARTLDLLAARGQVRTAEMSDLNWNVILGDSLTSTVPMTTAGSDQTTGDTVQATLGIGSYKIYHQFSITRVSMKDAAAKGTEKLKQLFKVHVDAGMLSIRKRVNDLIWNGAGSVGDGGFVGFASVLDPAAVYAGIDPATWTNWVPILNTAGANRDLSKAILNNMGTLIDVEEVAYDTIVCNPVTAEKYRNLFELTVGQFQNQTAVQQNKVDMYSGSLYWDNRPIITDNRCPTGQLVFFDSGCVELMSFDLADADRDQLKRFGLKDNFSTLASADVGGLRINVALLPQTNPGALQFQMFVVPQMRVLNRRMVQAILKLN